MWKFLPPTHRSKSTAICLNFREFADNQGSNWMGKFLSSVTNACVCLFLCVCMYTNTHKISISHRGIVVYMCFIPLTPGNKKIMFWVGHFSSLPFYIRFNSLVLSFIYLFFKCCSSLHFYFSQYGAMGLHLFSFPLFPFLCLPEKPSIAGSWIDVLRLKYNAFEKPT